MTSGERARVIWLKGVVGWGVSSALLWSVSMSMTRVEGTFSEYFFVAAILFPMAGYVAGGMMWQDRLREERKRLLGSQPASLMTRVVDARELEPTWMRALHVWWAMTWRGLIAMLGSVIVGAVLGAIVGLLKVGSGDPTVEAGNFAQSFGAIVGLFISIIPVKLILGKNFGSFRLVLLDTRAPEATVAPAVAESSRPMPSEAPGM